MAKKYLLIILALILFFALAFINLYRISQVGQGNQTEAPAISLPTVAWEEASVSAYATDSAVLKIEADLWRLKEKLDRVDLDESGLMPPVLDLQIKY